MLCHVNCCRLVEEGHPEMEAAHVAMLHNGELLPDDLALTIQNHAAISGLQRPEPTIHHR